MREIKDGTRKNKGSKGIANTKNSKRSTGIFRIHQLLLTVYKKLQLIHNTSYTTNMKRPSIQIGV